MKKYFYEITFTNGKTIRRESVSKKLASAMFESMRQEMRLFKVDQVSWGLM